MSWSYDAEMGTDKDKVRFLIGDTNADDPQLQNEEITWLLTERPNVYYAAILACARLIARYSRLTSKSAGSLSISYGEKVSHYQALRDILKVEATETGAVATPVSTAMSKADKQIRSEDDDLNLSPLKLGQFDNPGIGATNG